MQRWIGIILFDLVFFSTVFGQESGDKMPFPFPDDVMQKVVRRILIYNYKQRRVSTTVPVVESISIILNNTDRSFDLPIRDEWLPEIRNLKFALVSEGEISEIEKVFVFNDIQQDDGAYSISVGNRDKCAGEGIVWILRIDSSKVRLWPSKKEGWGAVYCDTGPRKKP